MKKESKFLECGDFEKKSESRIIIKDPLYKQIFVEPEHKKYLDLKEFQRLRHIKQTTFVDFVYPSANHTRFSHCLGVYHLMKKVFENKLMKISDKEKELLILAALFHDLGHGPFSHFWERAFPHFNHEKTTREILINLGLSDVAKLLEGKSPYYYLISSSIDVDKLDYMARDSYFAGVSYGVAEVDFIIEHMYIKDGKLVIKPSALSSVEDLITQRVNLFKTVYLHKFAVEYEFLFMKIFDRVRELLKDKIDIKVNKHLLAFFDKKNTLENLQALNDVVIIAQVFEWAEHSDRILSDLCSMYVNRGKFKVVSMNYNKININKIKKEVAKRYDINYYFSEFSFPINIVQTDIYVDFGDKIKRIDEVSDLIKFYKKQNWKVDFVIYPRDVEV
ncbi:MAG: HD domain-containing protein [Candidatus Woesearchaeota archaeon]|jgi:HD superfamily phosphohydrolase|nr:HD domain-containing protein [Candidatus Woesearchaeota archaeon]